MRYSLDECWELSQSYGQLSFWVEAQVEVVLERHLYINPRISLIVHAKKHLTRLLHVMKLLKNKSDARHTDTNHTKKD